MNARIVLLVVPLIAFAQSSAPPPEVDRALRARATEFMQCYVDGSFRKAYEMVAEDTKDLYFAASKGRIKSFQIVDVKYTENFTKAEVGVRGVRETIIPGEMVVIPTDVVEVEKFKIEDGKWVWYDLPSSAIVTPTSLSHVDPAAPGASTVPLFPQLPMDVSPQGLQAAARRLLGQVNIDRSEVTLPVDQASEAKVVLHNGMAGPVQVQLAQYLVVPGFSVKLDKTQVGGGEDVVVLIRYEPSSLKPGDPKPGAPVELRLVVLPINQAFTVTTKFATAR